MLPRLAALTFAMLLSSCGQDRLPSTEENRQLDSAEAMLNEAPNELESVDEELPERR